jgi:hypothetical protein
LVQMCYRGHSRVTGAGGIVRTQLLKLLDMCCSAPGAFCMQADGMMATERALHGDHDGEAGAQCVRNRGIARNGRRSCRQLHGSEQVRVGSHPCQQVGREGGRPARARDVRTLTSVTARRYGVENE